MQTGIDAPVDVVHALRVRSLFIVRLSLGFSRDLSFHDILMRMIRSKTMRQVGLIASMLVLLWIVAPPRIGMAAEIIYATLSKVNDSKNQIQGFTFSPKAEFLIDSSSGPIVVVEGKFNREFWYNWSLLLGKVDIPLQKDGRFQVRVRVSQASSQIQFFAVSPFGIVEKESILIHISNWDRLKPKENRSVTKIFSWTPSLAYTGLAFSESNVAPFSESALTGKLSLNYQLRPGVWDAGFNTYATLLTLGSSQTGISSRSLGVNLRLSYVLSFVKEPWRVSLAGGGYYTSLSATNDLFGYSIAGPQLFPVFRRTLNRNTSVSGYFKFSFLKSAGGLVSFSDREIATGISLNRALASGAGFSFVIDLSELQLRVGDGRSVSLSSYSIGVAYTP